LSITAANVTYLTSAPVAGGSTILAFGGSSLVELSYIGTATFTGDGAATTATLNFIDGTNALGWVPSAVLIQRTGGNAASSIVSYASTTTNTGCTVNFSAAPGNNASISFVAFVLK